MEILVTAIRYVNGLYFSSLGIKQRCTKMMCTKQNPFFGFLDAFLASKKIGIILFLITPVFISCTGKPDAGAAARYDVRVQVTYQKDFGTETDTAKRVIDNGAQVFLYKSTDPVTDVASYSFDGKLTLKSGAIKAPDDRRVIDDKGDVVFKSLTPQRVSVLALSKYFPGQGRLLSTAVGPDEVNPKLIKINFYPNGSN